MNSEPLNGKRVLITGGTGSLGQLLVRRLLASDMGRPRRIIVFSRDEAKQHAMRIDLMQKRAATDEVIYRHAEELIEFRIGDVRDLHSVVAVLRDSDIVFHAAALKQVPTCEYFPFEAVQTNVGGAENIVRAIQAHQLPIETVVGISTDKAVNPVNVMGMTKAIQERLFIQANLRCPATRFICVRYGNVLASRGSAIPLFLDQIRHGGPVTVTTPAMTRFLLSLDEAVDAIFAAVRGAQRGETYVPSIRSAAVLDIVSVLIGSRPIQTVMTGIRPGEKIHELLVSDEERHRAVRRGSYYVIQPLLPELRPRGSEPPGLAHEVSSAHSLMDRPSLEALLRKHGLSADGAA